MGRLASLLLLVLFASCEASVPEGRFACEDDEDCPSGMVCRSPDERCFSADASGQRDGGDAGR